MQAYASTSTSTSTSTPDSPASSKTSNSTARLSRTHPVTVPDPDPDPVPAYFSHCPSAIILQLANDFLLDRDAARWAATERRMLSILQTYSIKRAVSWDEAWRWRWGSLQALMEALKNPNPNPNSDSSNESDSGSTANTNTNTASSTATAACLSASSRSPFRIGRLCATTVDDDRTMQEIMTSREKNRDGDGDGEDESESVFMQRLMPAYLPTTVECIILYLPLNRRFLPCSLPQHVTQLCIERFDPSFHCEQPDSDVSDSLNQNEMERGARIRSRTLPLNRLRLPHSLTKLQLGGWQGNSAVQLPILPLNLRVLHMGDRFSAPIDSIQWPSTLTSLTLSNAFNHPLECVRLPDSITYLNLGYDYNRPIERMHLPSSLTRLQFGFGFCQPLREWHPPDTLTHLNLPGRWNHGPSQLRLPANLQMLTLPYKFNEAGESLNLLHLPSTLLTPRLGGRMEGNDLAALTLPHSLTSLELGDGCDASLDDVRWPPHLTRLVTGFAFDQPLLHWSPPSSLTELALGDEHGNGCWNHPVSQLCLPSNLQQLSFGHAFDQPLTGLQFPASLRVLSFGRLNQSLSSSSWSAPASLEELDLGGWWNRPCSDLHLPPTLRKLKLSNRFNQPVDNEHGECILHLPSTLTELRFGAYFNQSLRCLRLPRSLRLLSIPCSYHDTSTSLNRIQPPLCLPPRLQCLEVWNESALHAHGWTQHPQWPKLIKQCGTAVSYVEHNQKLRRRRAAEEWRDDHESEC